MDQLLSVFPTLTPPSALPLPTILTILAAAVAVAAAIMLTFPRRGNWRRGPPGPTGWPVVGYLPYLTDRLHEDLHHLAKTYGPVFSLKMGQQPAIVVSSPDVTREILKQKDLTFSSRTITEAVRCVTYGATSLVFVPYGPRWRLLRKTLTTELFSNRSLELLQPARKLQVDTLLKNLNQAWVDKTAVNIADSTFVVSANLISNLVCSKTLFDNTKEGKAVKEMIWEILEVVGAPNIADLIPALRVLDPQGLKRRVWKVVKKFDDFFEKLIDERVEERKKGVQINANGRLDMLDVFLNYKSDKANADEIKEFDRVDIKGMLSDMFVAGTDTSSSTVEWGLTEVLRKPDIYKKVLAELDEVVGKERFVEESDISKLTYFQAVVKEVFRLHPGVPLLIPRRTDEETEVSGYRVPKHAIVFVNVWGMARDPKVWPEPEEFRPERFLDRPELDVKGQDFELLPFGTGRRSCVGMPLGHRMVHYELAALLHAFDWADVGEKVLSDMTEKVGITLQKAKGLVAVPCPRLRNFVYQ